MAFCDPRIILNSSKGNSTSLCRNRSGRLSRLISNGQTEILRTQPP